MIIVEALGNARVARADTTALLCAVLNRNRAHILAHPDDELAPVQEKLFKEYIARRQTGEPVAYILGRREFFGREFIVSPAVLIPRPETETLVEHALQILRRRPPIQVATLLDMGTGSGAIAITLALENTGKVTATDNSEAALEIARQNAVALGANIEFLKSDWVAHLGSRKFDIIVANPPYVAAADPHLAQGDLRFEPQAALTDGSADGLDSIRHITVNAPRHLKSGGWLLFEHGYDQAEYCHALLSRQGFTRIASTPDLAGIPRVIAGQWVG